MNKFLTILLLLLTCLSLTWASDDRGIGGTGKYSDDEDRGLGGTGKYAENDDRGMGGTGIIGTITNFGSIWVNGIEVELNENTQVQVDGMASTEDSLRLGQQVNVLAEQEGDIWFAKEVVINHAVIGRVDKVLDNGFIIQGMTINEDPNIPGEWPNLTVNDYIKVSGYFHDNQFYATDVVTTQNDNSWQLIAPVVFDKVNGWQIAGQAIPNAILQAKEGQIITLRGKYTQNGRELIFIRYETSIPFEGQSREYIVEDRGSKTARSRSYSRDAFEKKQRGFKSNFFERSPITGPGTFFGSPPPAFNGSWESGSWNNHNWSSNSDWSSGWEDNHWENNHWENNSSPSFNQQSRYGDQAGFSNQGGAFSGPSGSRSSSGGFGSSRSSGGPSSAGGGSRGGSSGGGHSGGGKW